MCSRSKVALFWIGSWTWGLPLELFGALGTLLMLCLGAEPIYSNGFVVNVFGTNWGGLEGGTFIFVQNNAPEWLLKHEKGHGLQNLIFGWLTPIIVTIPSAVRYWYRRILKISQPDYYSIWFEKQANKMGERL